MDAIRITPDLRAMGATTVTNMYMTEGDEANTFYITTPPSPNALDKGWYVAVPGTEYGGKVRNQSSVNENKYSALKYNGVTWGGLLDEHIICPNGSDAHYHLKGEANHVIEQLISYLGLTGIFVADTSNSGITLNYDVRFVPAFQALRTALSRVGARLSHVYDFQRRRCVLKAVEVDQKRGRTYVSDADNVTITRYTPVNHLICIGEGEMQERVVIHLYADKNGNISKTQSLFGVDEVAQLYDYTSADAETLEAEGRRTLAELQVFKEVEVGIPSASSDIHDLDDIISALDVATGETVRARVIKKTLEIDHQDRVVASYETRSID